MRLPSIESRARIAAMLFLLFACGNLFAQDAAPAPTISKADTVWVLVSAALVIFMTLPGLALFYGGLVRSKNVLSILIQNLAVFALVACGPSSAQIKTSRCSRHRSLPSPAR